MRHLIRGGGGCFSVGVKGREGQGGSSGLRYLNHFAQQGLLHLSWAQRSPGPPHRILQDHTWLDIVLLFLPQQTHFSPSQSRCHVLSPILGPLVLPPALSAHSLLTSGGQMSAHGSQGAMP